jgi:hypothetical protein
MNTLRFGTAAGLIAAALILAACTPPVLDTESGVQFGESGEPLVNLTLSLGGSGSARSISAETSRTSINYYEVAFIHNDFGGMLYTKSFYRGETVRLAVPPGIYDNDTNSPGHGSAILMAGHRDLHGKLRLLAWGIMTGVYVSSSWDRNISTGTGQTITAATNEVEFTLIGIEYIPYENSAAKAPYGFQIIAPTPAAWQQVTTGHTLNGHKLTIDGSTREISYYPLPDQVLGDTYVTLGNFDYYSKDIDGDGKWFDGNPATRGTIAGSNVSGEWGLTSISSAPRQDGDENQTDADDVITAQFQIGNLPNASVFPSLIYMVNNGFSNPFEVNAIPVDIGLDPGIPMIARHSGYGSFNGQLDSSAQDIQNPVTPSGVTGSIALATQKFDITLKTYPLPYNKSGGWALLNAQLHVKAFSSSEPRLKTWTIQTGADLYALDEAYAMDSLGGSILCGIGNPQATSISGGGILINGNNP